MFKSDLLFKLNIVKPPHGSWMGQEREVRSGGETALIAVPMTDLW